MTPLSLEPSKRIHALIGDYETEKRWREYDVPGSSVNLEPTNDRLRLVTKQNYPAPTFAELLRVLPRIGEMKGWTKAHRLQDIPTISNVRNKLSRLYSCATTGEQGMKDVENYLMKLLI